MSTNPTLPLASMRFVTVAVTLPTLFLRVSLDIAGPANLVDLIVAAVRPAVARWPASVVVTEH